MIGKNISQKILMVMGGLLIGLIILEIGLRIGGSAFIYIQERRNQEALKNKKHYRILCLGESTTALGGPNSYPQQLENILNSLQKQVTVKTINKGIPGVTTSMIVQNLDAHLEKYKPDMVVVMMGINDDSDDNEMYHSSRWQEFQNSLQSFRVIKVFIHLCRSFSHKLGRVGHELYLEQRINEDAAEEFGPYFELGWGHIADGDFDRAEKVFRQAVDEYPEDINAYINLSLCYAFNKKYAEAETIIKAALQKEPGNTDLHIELGQIYIFQQKWKQAISLFEQAQNLEADNDDILLALGWCYLNAGLTDQAREFFQRNMDQNTSRESYGAMKVFYEMLKNDQLADRYSRKANDFLLRTFNPITSRNYQILKKKVLKKNIKLVCVQYPRRNVRALKKMVGEGLKISFVDNEKSFNDGVQKEGYKAYFVNNFAGDFGHCTVKGYRLLADNISKIVYKLIFQNEGT